MALGCFPLRTVAFRGHGFSLLEKPTLRGLQTRAIPAGVNGPPLQTTIIIVKASYTVLLPNTIIAKEIHEDSCGKAKRWDPTASVLCEWGGSSRARGKRSVFPKRYLTSQSISTM